jgi:hypothetical protein
MKPRMRSRFLRPLLAVVFMLLCAFGIAASWRMGVGRLLARYAAYATLREQADRAVKVSALDAETHSARAAVLYNLHDVPGALRELESAVKLRPGDYLLWLQLGRAREEAGDKEGAILALRESMRLAPYYSEPRWQYGNVLYRMGRFEEAFDELRRAADSNPSLLPVLIDLAWGTYKGDAKAVEKIISPRTDAVRMALARFFIKKEKTVEALALIRALGEMSAEDRKALVVELIKSRQFKAAYEVWAVGEVDNERRVNVAQGITDPGFEGRINLTQKGFGWQQERELEGVKLSLDTKEPEAGARSLLIEWNGQPNPPVSVITQTVLVEPNSRYRLRFYARTEKLVTAGLPVLDIADASSKESRVLAESKAFPQDAPAWQEFEVEFSTSDSTEAVIISLRRQNCDTNPCPVFGRVWLDDFSLRKL